jgi:hypothetical protein
MMGERTFSLLDRLGAKPITDVSSPESVRGADALLISSLTMATANCPAAFSPSFSSDRTIKPISQEAVDATINTSFKCGWKSRSLTMNWYAGARFIMKPIVEQISGSCWIK